MDGRTLVAFLFTCIAGLSSAHAAPETKGGKAPVPVQDFMISIFWAPPSEHTNDKQYDYLKEAHINVVPCIHPSLAGQADMQRRVLDLAHARGMKVMVYNPKRYTDVKAVVADFKEHPALWGYYLKDEPRLGEFTKYGRMVRDFLKHDPDHIPFVNMLPAGPGGRRENLPWREFLQKWIDAAGADNLHYLVYDNYPFADLDQYTDPYVGRGRSHGHIQDYFSDLETIRQCGMANNLMTGLYLQSVGIEKYLRRPDENDLRWNVYTALAYGIKSIQWFTWWTPTGRDEPFTNAIIDPNGNKTDLYDVVKKLNAQIKTLGPTLLELDAVEVYHSGVVPEGTKRVPDDYFFKPANPDDALLISHMVDSENGRDYIMVVNKDNRSLKKHAKELALDGPKTLRFRVSRDITGLTLMSKNTGSSVPMDRKLAHGIFSDSFLPGEGHLYMLPKGDWGGP